MPRVTIEGPYRHRDKWRCRLASQGQRVWCATGETAEAARGNAEAELADYQKAIGITGLDVVEAYLGYLRSMDRKPASVDAARVKLSLILGDKLDAPAALTEHQAKDLYAAIVPTCAAASHREALRVARSCWKWATEEGIVKLNPWLRVRKVGKPRRGKQQLTLDQTRQLVDHCAERLHEDGAVVALMAVLMGMRCTEITSRRVQDVDNKGQTLRITDSKTETGKRPLDIPEVLAPALAARCGRAPDAPLLPTVDGLTGPGARTWAYRQVRQWCRNAGVPEVCPHSLRGTFATVSYEAAAMPHLVAAALGHASSKTTERHYAEPAAVQRAAMRKRLSVLDGGNQRR